MPQQKFMVHKNKEPQILILKSIRRIDPLNPQPEMVKEAALAVSKGGVVCFPTKCLYGLGADALDPAAVEKIFQIKKRPFQKPILVLIKNKNDLRKLAKSVPPVAERLMNRFWPGRVTLVFEAVDSLPIILTAGSGKIGVRLPGHPLAHVLVQALKNPMTGTSANISGLPGCASIHDLHPFISDKLDLILDAGVLKGGIGSTVVDVTVFPPEILREGEVPANDIFNAVKGIAPASV